MAFVGTLIVSTKRDRGHIGSNTPSQSAANKASAANDPGATDDRGRDVTAGSLGVESGETTRREREPGVLLAQVASRRAAWKQHGHAAGAGEGRERSIYRGSERGRFSSAIGNPGDQALERDASNLWHCGCDGTACRDRVSGRMIGLPAGTRIWIAAGVTDLRRGFTGLSGMVQTALQENPFSGHVFVFRGRRGDLIKMLWWDGDGLCLFAKRLERGRFIWPQAASGTVSLTQAQLSMLLEGIDWRRPVRSYDPQMAV
jgi:transposase